MSRLPGSVLYVDGASGCAGDMFLAAALDLGVPLEVIAGAIARLGDGLTLKVEKVVRGGIAATNVRVLAGGEAVEVEHEHEHGHGHGHGHRHYADIRRQVVGAGLEETVRELALDIFDRLARAEAALHGTTVERVAFHELGALDALADVVGAAAALAWLRPARVFSAPVAVGGGTVGTAHGRLPVPAPASLAVLTEAGATIRAGDIDVELCTPTGAAVLAAAVTEWRAPPALVPVAVGYGAGDRELADRPNVLRLTAAAAAAEEDELFRLEANIDDMSPEIAAHAAARAMDAGAVDVWWTPITMKKGRPAWLLSALAPAAARGAVERTLFAETTTIGIRVAPVSRSLAERHVVEVETVHGLARVKVARVGGEVVNAAPEYESCAALARERGVPLKEVYAAAVAAYRAGTD